MDTRVRIAARAALHVLRACGPTTLEALWGKVPREVCDARIARWSRDILADIEVALDVRGREHLEPAAPLVVMSNHQSLYDIPVLYQTLSWSLRMVSKKEIFYIPIFGHAMRAAEMVRVDRENRAQAIESLHNARHLIASGIVVWIAPEGTRSADGRLGPFKKGGFILAEDADVPVLPITIDGTCRILPARTTDIHLGETVKVTIHPRSRRADFPSREAWMTHVRDAIASALPAP
jgi:1-acyl-sn-glycerol-3-phosphate acyltransferase